MAERGKVITALQHRDDAALAVCGGKARQMNARPGVIVDVQFQMRQRVFAVHVEPGRNQQQIWGECRQPRQRFLCHLLPERRALAAGRQGKVQDVVIGPAFARKTR